MNVVNMKTRKRKRKIMKMNNIKTVLAIAVLVISAFGLNVSAEGKPLKVYIMAGQSNMQGRARISTLGHMAMDPETAPMAKKMVDGEGNPRAIDNVWIASLGVNKDQTEKKGQLIAGYGYSGGGGTKIGPEMGFAITMQEHTKEPILIIKTTWGGKSLFLDFRPPSAGVWDFGPGAEKDSKDPDKVREDRRKISGVYYRRMVDYINKVLADIKRIYPDYDSKQGYEIAGFSWFQGVHDFGDGATYPNLGSEGCYDEYSRLLACFIRDVRKDLKTPKMPFVIGVLGISGDLRNLKTDDKFRPWILEFRKAMAAPADMPEFKGNVIAVHTEKYWEPGLEEIGLRYSKIKAKEGELKSQQVANLENKPRLRRVRLNAENQAKLEAYKLKVFTAEELNLMMTGTSNAAYHYLGSYKIYSRIGKAFAEAIIDIEAN